MKYNLAFKYRIYPNKDQELLINKTFGCVRFVYNTIFFIYISSSLAFLPTSNYTKTKQNNN